MPCPICNDEYTEEDKKNTYHVTYKPEIITDACRGCNWAEHLIQHPDLETPPYMIKRKELVRKWTLKNRPMIS
ncbi:MAG: hypothetical protein V4486_03830 [Patescibacteria group bacterium]